MALSTLLAAFALIGIVRALPLEVGVQPHDFGQSHPVVSLNTTVKPAPFCFPSLGFIMPLELPTDTTGWWCDPSTEYAFLGFSYEITACGQCPPSSHAFVLIPP